MDDFYRPNTGTQFDHKTGKLFRFERDRITVATCWPKPMAWEKTPHKGWNTLRLNQNYFHLAHRDLEREIWRIENVIDEDGQFQFPFMLSSYDRQELARLRWYLTIPQTVRSLLLLFRQRQWHILSMLARCGDAAADVTRSSPALAFAMASNWVFHKPAVQRPLRSIRALLRPGKKQKDILGWLGFPATESARKILGKVVSQSIEINRLLYLRRALKRSEFQKGLCHAPRLNAGALRILTDENLLPHATPQLINEVALSPREDTRPGTAYNLRDTLNMFDRVYPRRRFPRLRSCSDLDELHHEMIYSYNHLPPENLLFPSPPVQGNSQIVPILDAESLWREGIEMKHCVSSYSRQIAVQQNVFVYKVLAPERCTLSIRKLNSQWQVSELKRSCNRLTSQETLSLVNSWLTLRQNDASANRTDV